MHTDPRIQFHGLPKSESLIANIEERINRLERFFPEITSCRVTVDRPHHKRAQGDVFRASIDLRVPGTHLVVDRCRGDAPEHTDPYLSVRDAFDAMQRKLQEYARKRRYEVKTHIEPQSTGEVARLMTFDGYGFIKDQDGREVYFDRNAVLGDFDALAVGSRVRFSDALGEEGPQATTVRAIRRKSVRRLPREQYA